MTRSPVSSVLDPEEALSTLHDRSGISTNQGGGATPHTTPFPREKKADPAIGAPANSENLSGVQGFGPLASSSASTLEGVLESAPLGEAAMIELTMEEMGELKGGEFWSGFGCGLATVGAFVLIVSPDPLSKVALITYAGTIARCATAF
jgi:hypothetical protein